MNWAPSNKLLGSTVACVAETGCVPDGGRCGSLFAQQLRTPQAHCQLLSLVINSMRKSLEILVEIVRLDPEDIACEHKKRLSKNCWLSLQESAVWVGKRRALRASGANTSVNWTKTWMLIKLYWHRQLGTALSWFVWDFAFYGNKLFQSTFIAIIVPGASVKTSLEWTLLNSTVALAGYYFAAFTIDKRWMGRSRMQVSHVSASIYVSPNIHSFIQSLLSLLVHA